VNDIVNAFAHSGVVIDDGVAAFQGASPRFVWPDNAWGLMFVKRRALTVRQGELSVWRVYSGFVPGRNVADLAPGALVFDHRRSWDRITCVGLKLWVRAHDRVVIHSWLESSELTKGDR
jgi:hypothetical protein